MDTASQVLVIIISSVLGIFLVLFIVALVYIIGIARRVREIVSRAESVAGSVEAAASAFEKTATPLAVLKLVSNIVAHAQKRKKE